MKRVFAFSFVFALGTASCAPHWQHAESAHHHAHDGDGIAPFVVAVGVTGLALHDAMSHEEPEVVVEHDAPAPVVVVARPGDFDRNAAKSALSSVVYKDCGQGGPATMILEFGSNGTVRRAGIEDGKYDKDVAACVVGRFQVARVPAFAAEPHAVSWRIYLPLPLHSNEQPTAM